MVHESMPRLPAAANQALDQLSDDAAQIYARIGALVPPAGVDDLAWGDLLDRAQQLIQDIERISSRAERLRQGEPDLLTIMGDQHAA